MPNESAYTSVAQTTALAASLVIKAAGGVLISLTGYNSGAAQFIQVHNAASLPSNTAVPLAVFKAEATQNFYFELSPHGLRLTTGIVVCNSSTAATKTIGAADCWFVATYR
jgi:hypothetical protein